MTNTYYYKTTYAKTVKDDIQHALLRIQGSKKIRAQKFLLNIGFH